MVDPVTVGHEPLDGVGDLELAAGRRLDRRDRGVDRRVEEVDADQREVGRRHLGLLDELHDLAVGADLGDAEGGGILDLGQEDLGGGGDMVDAELGFGVAGALETVDELGEALLEHVVAQVHDEVVVAEEVAGDQHAVGETERLVLHDPGDRHAELRSVTDVFADLVAGCRRDDDPDLLDPGGRHVLDPVEQDRLVGDGHQLLRAGVGDGAKPGSGTAAEDETLHGRQGYRGRATVSLGATTHSPSRGLQPGSAGTIGSPTGRWKPAAASYS